MLKAIFEFYCFKEPKRDFEFRSLVLEGSRVLRDLNVSPFAAACWKRIIFRMAFLPLRCSEVFTNLSCAENDLWGILISNKVQFF